MNKNKTEKNSKDILYERALVTCLVMLGISVILKLFGANWFDLNTDIPLLQKLDSLITNDIIISFIVTLIFKTINGMIICSLMTKDLKAILKKTFLFAIITVISMVLNFFNINSFLYDFISLIVAYKIIDKNASIKEGLLVMVLNTIYQLLSLYLRDLSYIPQSYSFIYYSILSLDYYILLAITYLILKKGEMNLCGVVVAFYSSLKSLLWKKPSKSCSISSDGQKG